MGCGSLVRNDQSFCPKCGTVKPRAARPYPAYTPAPPTAAKPAAPAPAPVPAAEEKKAPAPPAAEKAAPAPAPAAVEPPRPYVPYVPAHAAPMKAGKPYEPAHAAPLPKAEPLGVIRPAADNAAVKPCPKCGTLVSRNIAICLNCGIDVFASDSESASKH